MDDIYLNNNRYQLYLIPINLKRTLSSDPAKAIRAAEKHLSSFIKNINYYIQHPDNPAISSTWVNNTLHFYCALGPGSVADSFFQSIDLPHIAKLQQAEQRTTFSSSLLSFLRCIIGGMKCVNSDTERNRLLREVFKEIDLTSFGLSIKTKIQTKLMIVNCPDYSSDNDVTWASLIKGISDLIYKCSNLTEDEDTHKIIREKVSGFYSAIDFHALGKLMDIQEKSIGPVVRVLDMVRKVPDERIRNSAQLSFLTGFNFRRLAESYNRKPIGSVGLASFCKRYSPTKEVLHSNWKIFFEELNFRLPFSLAHFTEEEYKNFTNAFPKAKDSIDRIIKRDNDGVRINVVDIIDSAKRELADEATDEILKRTGFNTVDFTMLFQRLNQIFNRSDPMREKILGRFDFRVIGLRVRGKSPKSVDQLLRRLKDLDLTRDKYEEFLAGLGEDDYRRRLQEGNKHIEAMLKTKRVCNDDR